MRRLDPDRLSVNTLFTCM